LGDLVGVKAISRIGTRTPGWVPVTNTFREAGNGLVVTGGVPVGWPLVVMEDPFIGS
jgi:hypothetical protein